jgi:hypothetical protein
MSMTQIYFTSTAKRRSSVDKEQYLLAKVAEEAAEVAKEALKGAIFGLQDKAPGGDLTNATKIYTELQELIAVIDMLDDEIYDKWGYYLCMDCDDKENIKRAKKLKVKQWMEYSIKVGCLEDHQPTMEEE